MSLSGCVQCKSIGLVRSAQEIYPCTLCGQPRCEEHSVWVPSFALDESTESARCHLNLLTGETVKGWYAFCGRLSHIPNGAPIRHGKERKWGKVVERIPYDERFEGLEIFPLWQTGIVEDGYEKHWDSQHYELSCNLSAGMRLLTRLFQYENDSSVLVEKIHSVVVDRVGGQRSTFFSISFDKFRASLTDSPTLKELAGSICSRCGVVLCLNRQAPFHDEKILKRLAKKPESMLSM